MQILQPPGWERPRGYSNGIVATGKLVFISGQIGWDAQQQFQTTDFVAQARQALQNVLDILAECGGKPENITRMTWYLVDKAEYQVNIRDLGKVYQELMADHYPAMSAVEVCSLMEVQARLEIEATAVIP